MVFKNLFINESSNIFNNKHIKFVIIKINIINTYMLTLKLLNLGII